MTNRDTNRMVAEAFEALEAYCKENNCTYHIEMLTESEYLVGIWECEGFQRKLFGEMMSSLSAAICAAIAAADEARKQGRAAQ